MEELIINFAPTGMCGTQETNAYLPVSAGQIIEQVHEANELGITLAHLHARNEDDQSPAWEKEVYAEILSGIKTYCPELVVCVSLSGRVHSEREKRSDAISLSPDMGSLTLGSLNFPKQASINSPDTIQFLLEQMKQYGVVPELEVFDLGMIQYAKHLLSRGLIEKPCYFNVICGNIAGIQADALSIGTALAQLPADCYWALGGIGKSQLPAIATAIANGGGVRVGLEDNLFFDRAKTEPATNRQLIQRVHDLADVFERPVMSPANFGNLGFYNTKSLRGQKSFARSIERES